MMKNKKKQTTHEIHLNNMEAWRSLGNLVWDWC